MFLWRSLTPAVLASTAAKPQSKPVGKGNGAAAPAKPAKE
jgi:hypothetical protein